MSLFYEIVVLTDIFDFLHFKGKVTVTHRHLGEGVVLELETTRKTAPIAKLLIPLCFHS